MASRLSYLLWGTMPDPDLTSAARQGKLVTPEGVRAEAERMLNDDRAHDVVRYFHGMLLGTLGLDHLERDAGYYPTFQSGMGALFRQETEKFLDDVVWKGSGDLSGIFSAPYTFVNGPLATFYGLPGITGAEFQKVTLDGSRRAGLLTQASILTVTTPGSRTDPVVRGKWVYTKLLCGQVGDPPPNVPKLPDPAPGQGVRDRLAMHRAVPPCSGCHRMMDPIGFGFEHYDGVGLWRDQDNDLPIDDSGEIFDTDAAGTFHGPTRARAKAGQEPRCQELLRRQLAHVRLWSSRNSCRQLFACQARAGIQCIGGQHQSAAAFAYPNGCVPLPPHRFGRPVGVPVDDHLEESHSPEDDAPRRRWARPGASILVGYAQPRRSHADTSIPTRFLVFYTPGGTLLDRWRPKGTATDFILQPMMSPLTPFLDRMVFVDGLKFFGDPARVRSSA